MRAGQSPGLAHFRALGSNSYWINAFIFLGLGFLVCKMGQRCPLSKLGEESMRQWMRQERMWQEHLLALYHLPPASMSPCGPLLPTTRGSAKGCLLGVAEPLCAGPLCFRPLLPSLPVRFCGNFVHSRKQDPRPRTEPGVLSSCEG